MPTPPFRKLSGLWSDSRDAAELIARYRDAVERWVAIMEHAFLHEDFLPLAMEALYLTAFAPPSDASFYQQWRRNAGSRCAPILRRRRNWVRLVRAHRLPVEAIDTRMYYRSG